MNYYYLIILASILLIIDLIPIDNIITNNDLDKMNKTFST